MVALVCTTWIGCPPLTNLVVVYPRAITSTLILKHFGHDSRANRSWEVEHCGMNRSEWRGVGWRSRPP